jgi:hypothetical protein
MPRFYINDGNRPGVRCPQPEYRTKSGRQSDILNEAQAITRRRKLLKTRSQYQEGRYWRVQADTAILGNWQASPSAWVVRELEMYDGFNVKVSAGATPIVSSRWRFDVDADKLVDGITTGLWTSWYSAATGGLGEWCGFLFTENVAVRRVRLFTYSPNWYSPSSVSVYSSEDGSSWTFAKSFSTPQVADAVYDLTLP